MPEMNRPELFTLRNRAGLEIEIANYGGTVAALRVPDRDGRLDDIVLGFDTPEEYLGPHPFFGGIIGRYANRIAHGRFRLDGRDYELARNNEANHLHGGPRGFHRVFWNAHATSSSVVLTRRSDDGEEGYPGAMGCRVTYSLTETSEFTIDYEAMTDRPTILNLTHHSYFNLGGGGDVLGHRLFVDADTFLPVDEGLIPTGEKRSVAGTAFDFREPREIGERIRAGDPQLALGRGYDHNFCLNPGDASPGSPKLAARLIEPRSGRVMEILTTEPGLQVYSGGALDGTIKGKAGSTYGKHAGLCLETQHFPDSPNQLGFPKVRLDPGEIFRSTTIHRFSTVP
jgi:aldose 1-epimerase